jgi:hypothetical protein
LLRRSARMACSLMARSKASTSCISRACPSAMLRCVAVGDTSAAGEPGPRRSARGDDGAWTAVDESVVADMADAAEVVEVAEVVEPVRLCWLKR